MHVFGTFTNIKTFRGKSREVSVTTKKSRFKKEAR